MAHDATYPVRPHSSASYCDHTVCSSSEWYDAYLHAETSQKNVARLFTCQADCTIVCSSGLSYAHERRAGDLDDS